MRCEDFIVSEQQSNRMYGAVLPRGGHCRAQRQTRRVGGASLPVETGLPCAPVQLLNPLFWWQGGRSFPAGQGQPRLLDLLLARGLGCAGASPYTCSDCTHTSPPAGTASIVIPILLLLILLTVVAFVWYKWRIKG